MGRNGSYQKYKTLKTLGVFIKSDLWVYKWKGFISWKNNSKPRERCQLIERKLFSSFTFILHNRPRTCKFLFYYHAIKVHCFYRRQLILICLSECFIIQKEIAEFLLLNFSFLMINYNVHVENGMFTSFKFIPQTVITAKSLSVVIMMMLILMGNIY